jgi:hypothetical protein
MRIISFGPSEMFGHGLEDCFMPPYNPGPTPSKFAYPSLVANHLKCECINLSSPGCGALDVLVKIIGFDFNNDDIVLVQWPSLGTATLISEDSNLVNIQPWMAEDSLKILKHVVGADLIRYQADKSKLSIDEQLTIARNFYKTHSDRHLSVTNCLYMDYAALYLDSKNLKKVFGGAESWNFEYSPVTDHRVMKNHGNFSDFALDGQHPGPLWHQQIANEILSILQ